MFLRSTALNRRVFRKALTAPARHCSQCLLVPTFTDLVLAESVAFMRGSRHGSVFTVSTERRMGQ